MAGVSVAELVDGHATLEVECLDRIYLNAYISNLQTAEAVVWFLREELGNPIAFPAFPPIRFRENVKRFAMRQNIPLIRFAKHDRKIDAGRPYLQAAERDGRLGVVRGLGDAGVPQRIHRPAGV